MRPANRARKTPRSCAVFFFRQKAPVLERSHMQEYKGAENEADGAQEREAHIGPEAAQQHFPRSILYSLLSSLIFGRIGRSGRGRCDCIRGGA